MTRFYMETWRRLAIVIDSLEKKMRHQGRTMRAMGFKRYGPAEVLEPLEVKRPMLAPGTVLIRVTAAGMNPADALLRSRRLRLVARSSLPFVPGADVAGVVEAVGSAVTRFRRGDAVYTMLPSIGGGGYAGYAAVAEETVAIAPPSLSLTEAAAVPLAALTALQALRDEAKLERGARVLVNGASGGVGTFAVQIAGALGARVVAATSARNAGLVSGLGAEEVLDYASQDVTVGEARYDVVFDAVGVYSFRRGAGCCEGKASREECSGISSTRRPSRASARSRARSWAMPTCHSSTPSSPWGPSLRPASCLPASVPTTAFIAASMGSPFRSARALAWRKRTSLAISATVWSSRMVLSPVPCTTLSPEDEYGPGRLSGPTDRGGRSYLPGCAEGAFRELRACRTPTSPARWAAASSPP